MRLPLLAVLTGLLVALLPATAAAQTTASVTVKPKAVLLADGTAQVTVSVRCTLGPGDQLLEGLVSLSQEQASGFGSLNPTCTGKRERIVVQVSTTGAPFAPGEATASAFLLFLDPESGTTVSAQDSRTVKLSSSPGS